MDRRVCKKCLFGDFDADGIYASITELIELMPPEKKADEALYLRRLGICKACGELGEGTCGKCGCYVELRAAKKDMHCPHEKHFW